MTELVAPGLPSDSARGLSASRAFWLLLRLRYVRRRNLRHQGYWARVAGAPVSRNSGAPARGGLVGTMFLALFPLLFLAVQSTKLFDAFLREQGVAGMQGRAALACSVNVCGLLLAAVAGSRAWDRQGADDVEWLSTLPAPTWVLQSARLLEATLLSSSGWFFLFPLFTGLGWHVGLGWKAPLIAVALCLPIGLCCAVVSSAFDSIQRVWATKPVLRYARFVLPGVAYLLLFGWVCASALQALKLNPFGDWLDFTGSLPWLPFSEPARALVSWSESPLVALGWLGLFALELTGLLGVGLWTLRKWYRADLVAGSGLRLPLRGAQGRANSPRRRPLSLRLGPIAAKEWLWVARNPLSIATSLVGVTFANGLALAGLNQAGKIESAARPGLALLGAGTMLLFGQIGVLERERTALPYWATLPRSISWLLVPTTLLGVGQSLVGAMPLVGYALWQEPNPRSTLPFLLYGGLCVVVLGFFQTALWLRRVNPSTPPSGFRVLARSMQLFAVAFTLGTGFRSTSTLPTIVGLFVVVAALAATLWHDAEEALPNTLDPSAPLPATVTATYALVVIFVLHALQGMVLAGAQRRMTPAGATSLAIIVAAMIVLPLSLIWLWMNRGGVPELAQRLGLGLGKGPRAIVREGLLWGSLSIAFVAVFWLLGGHGLARVPELAPEHPPVLVTLRSSAWAMVVMGVIVAPLTEELVYRGMLHRALRSSWTLVPSLLVSATPFTVNHTLQGAPPIFFMATAATLALERSGSLLAAMLAHAVYNGAIVALQIVAG
ncbi:MAG: CPBP family glutamic-type intramembrane protease [Polyangiaceae bacterium]